MLETFKAVGKRGSWFAKVNGESFPCVHAHWWKSGKEYFDPHLRPDTEKGKELIEGIQKSGKVIITKDDFQPNEVDCKRTGYVAGFSVSNIEFNEDGLRFRFDTKLFNLK
jgi:hypothetical protein